MRESRSFVPLVFAGVTMLTACGGGSGGGGGSDAPSPTVDAPAIAQTCLDDVPPVAERSLVDRVDDVSGAQLHFVYAIPADADDDALDTTGQLQDEAKVAQRWIQQQTGRCLEMDTFQGALDVTFMQFSRTNAEMRADPDFVDQTVELELEARGFDDPDKTYVVYYGGSADDGSCGGAAQIGGPAMQYLAAESAGGALVTCLFFSFVSGPDADFRGSWAGVAMHETFHSLGVVPFCAPDHEDGNPLHLRTRSSDLMANDGSGFSTFTLDANRDQYYDHDNAGCLDLADSAIWTDAAAGADPLPGKPPAYIMPTFIPCADEPLTQSGDVSNVFALRLVNGTASPVYFYPLDQAGVRQTPIITDPFSPLEVFASEEEVFVATNGETGECIGLYRVVPGSNRIVISE